MKRTLHIAAIAAIATLAAALPAVADVDPKTGLDESPVAVNLERFAPAERARIAEKAALGQTELIRYLNRTRNIHGQVRLADIVVPDEAALLAMKEAQARQQVATAEAK